MVKKIVKIELAYSIAFLILAIVLGRGMLAKGKLYILRVSQEINNKRLDD
ncbi:MAG: hypothetical protein N2B06_17970 [Clostridium sp.]